MFHVWGGERIGVAFAFVCICILQDGHGSVQFGPVLTSPVSKPVPVSKVPVSNLVLLVPVPPGFDRSHPRTERSRGVFFGHQKRPKTGPDTPKLKTSKTDVNNPFQELSLKPSYSSHREDAHSWILVPKGRNRAKIEFPGPNVRVKIGFHPVLVPSSSGFIQFRFHPVSFGTQLHPVRFQIVQLTVLRFGLRLSCIGLFILATTAPAIL